MKEIIENCDFRISWGLVFLILAAIRQYIADQFKCKRMNGSSSPAPVFPKDYNALREVNFLNKVVLTLLHLPGAICYFNPNGEVLYDLQNFQDILMLCEEQKKIPLPLWMNIRFFKLTNELFFMDTVGNGQLDIKDIEAIFPITDYDAGTVDYYLRNVTHYLLDAGQEIKDNDAIDGPNEPNLSWVINLPDEGTFTPPRQVLRLYPKACSKKVLKAISVVD